MLESFRCLRISGSSRVRVRLNRSPTHQDGGKHDNVKADERKKTAPFLRFPSA